MRPIEYRNILKPSVEYPAQCDCLMLDTRGLAEFLGLPYEKMGQLLCTGRVPLPCRLGLGRCKRWSVLELLEWVGAGCPGRLEWIKLRGSTGGYPRWR